MPLVCIPFSFRPVYVSTVRPQSKHIVVIVDHGASVTETQLQIAKDAAQVILSSIDEHDKVSFLYAVTIFSLVFWNYAWYLQPKQYFFACGPWLVGICGLPLMSEEDLSSCWKPVLLWRKHLGILRLRKVKTTDLRENLVSVPRQTSI